MRDATRDCVNITLRADELIVTFGVTATDGEFYRHGVSCSIGNVFHGDGSVNLPELQRRLNIAAVYIAKYWNESFMDPARER